MDSGWLQSVSVGSLTNKCTSLAGTLKTGWLCHAGNTGCTGTLCTFLSILNLKRFQKTKSIFKNERETEKWENEKGKWTCSIEFVWVKCVHDAVVVVQSLNHVPLFVTLWTLACQAPLSMGLFRQEYRSGLHLLLQGIFPTQELNPRLLHWQADSLPLSHLRIP